MDAIFTQLQKTALEKAAVPETPKSTGTGSFQNVFDQVSQPNDMGTDKLMEMVDKSFGMKNDVSGIDASSIHIEVSKAEGLDKTPKAGHVLEMLQDINKDQLQFDNIRDILSSGKSVNMKDLLAAQLACGQLTMQFEAVSKGVEGVNKLINQPYNMQIG